MFEKGEYWKEARSGTLDERMGTLDEFPNIRFP
jgi:hypothetical protein